ncbi:hypothetical protein J4442_03425 [Candidatus Woesearchaeota archaeon]|nr:hypothetical protein [Candidatus Woesearchaeota archaeon]
MDNETKYSLIIIGVALLALVAFNYNDFFTGGVVLKNQPTTFIQERLLLVRTLDVPGVVKNGETLNVIFVTNEDNDLIQTNKEKILIYQVDGDISKFKRQLTYPRCIDGVTSRCYAAEDSFSIPVSWDPGKYKIQVEREAKVDGKAITEIVGRVFFNII